MVQMQDLLGLGSEARMNIPSTLGGNWQWRALPGSYGPKLARAASPGDEGISAPSQSE